MKTSVFSTAILVILTILYVFIGHVMFFYAGIAVMCTSFICIAIEDNRVTCNLTVSGNVTIKERDEQ